MSGGGPVFCMGGGGFTMEAGRPALDAYILSLSAVANPRVLFLPTAGGDQAEQVKRFQDLFGGWSCRPRVLPLFHLVDVTESLEELVLHQDVVYVGGGSMRNLLALWGAHGVADLLVEAHRRGTVLAGLSAGAMCWMEGGVSMSSGDPETIEGLGLVRGSFSVHAAQQPARGEVQREAIRTGALPDGWDADDGCGLLFVDGRLEEVVAGRDEAMAHRVERTPEGEVRRTPIRPRRLEPVAEPATVASRHGDVRRGVADLAQIDARDELREVRRIRGRAHPGPRRRAG